MSHHIVWGKTFHQRYTPIDHRFEYAMTMVSLAFFVKDGGLFPSPFPKWFGWHSRGLFRVSVRHHLGGDCSEENAVAVAFFERITTLLYEKFGEIVWDRLQMITIPQFIFPPFKPVTFYCVYSQNRMMALIAEVANTYREKVCYVMPVTENRSEAKKTFHVSPFFDESGTYYFEILPGHADAGPMRIAIEYKVEDVRVFLATFSGAMRPMTQWSLLLTLFRATALPVWTLPRIYFQAAKLTFSKGLTAMQKPPLNSPNVQDTMPLSWFQKRVQDRLFAVFRQADKGALVIIEPNGKRWVFGDTTISSPAIVQIHHNWFYRRVAIGGEIGFGEAYVDGYWDSPDLSALLSFFVHNRAHFLKLFDGHVVQFFLDKFAHFRRENTIQKSKENIQAHYDLGNLFYDFFLDASKVYSSAVFVHKDDNLDVAQQRKLDMIIAKARIKQHHHVLEIGSGWGALAIRMAQTTGCRVTTITLSPAQKEEVEAKVLAAGLSDLVVVKLQDFRHVRGTFDRIVSVEMLEAVGHRYLGVFFEQLEALLGRNGIAVLQVITYPDYGYAAYLRGTDFIRKHIFPGGHLPSVSVLMSAAAAHSTLVPEHLENLGPHYAKTLALWRENLESRVNEVLALGFDAAFIRKFRYYFAYCEAAFSARYLGVHQLVLSRSFNEDLEI